MLVMAGGGILIRAARAREADFGERRSHAGEARNFCRATMTAAVLLQLLKQAPMAIARARRSDIAIDARSRGIFSCSNRRSGNVASQCAQSLVLWRRYATRLHIYAQVPANRVQLLGGEGRKASLRDFRHETELSTPKADALLHEARKVLVAVSCGDDEVRCAGEVGALEGGTMAFGAGPRQAAPLGGPRAVVR